jgi:pimeloyl-ACP methyl ester carboxylesterase
VIKEQPQIDPPTLEPVDGRRIAFRRRAGAEPGVVWLGGFKSDMLSTKASRLDDWARAAGRAFLRFDYSGHGESDGRFEDGTIGQWLAESIALIRARTRGPQILVGSSMGGWIALLVARELARLGEADRLAGLVLIAPAVDFTEALMWARMSDDIKREIMETGRWLRPSAYSPEPYAITRALIEEGRAHLMLDGLIRAHAPVHILQGMQDPDVPWRHAMELVQRLSLDPVSVSLVREGDHRLSRDEDIEMLIRSVERIA